MLAWTGEPDRISDKLGDEQLGRVGSVTADSPAGTEELPDIPASPERGGRQRGERECSGIDGYGARPAGAVPMLSLAPGRVAACLLP